jgi:hypothetical protein
MLILCLLAAAPGNVRAQYGYPSGYGGYGWGGWGSTPGSAMARGLGYFNMGRGAYNYDTAVARSINADTVQRWNQYVYQSYQATRRQYNASLRAYRARIEKARGEIHDRIRNHPETLDITDGDALNVLLDELLNPALAGSSLRMIGTPVRPDLIQEIPFEVASEGMTLCLDQMTMNEQWPLALRVDDFRPERELLKKVVATALEEDKEGNLEPKTIEAVHAAIDQFRLKFEKLVPQSNPDYLSARNTLKAMAGITKMLYSPKMEQIIAELEDYQGTTLGELLSFMQAFNLRFAPANSFRQKRVYMKLYPLLAEQANGPLGSLAGTAAGLTGAARTVENAGASAAQAAESAARQTVATAENSGNKVYEGLKSAAIDLFKDMDWKHLSGSPGAPAPGQP